MKRLVLLCIVLISGFLAAQDFKSPAIDYNARSLTLSLADPPQKTAIGVVQIVGNPGRGMHYYWIVTNSLAGASSPAGPFVLVNAPNTLSVTNYAVLNWSPQIGALSYDVLRTATARPPDGACDCAVAIGVAGTSVNDQSDALQPYTVAAFDPGAAAITLTNESGSGLVARQHGQQVAIAAYPGVSSDGAKGIKVDGAVAVSATVQLGAGVDATGATDVSNSLQSALDAAAAAGRTLVAGGTYKISRKIVIKGNVDFSAATFKVYGNPAIAVEVSNADDPQTILADKTIKLPNIINAEKAPAPLDADPAKLGWDGYGVGLRVINAQSCQITVGHVYGFAIGMLVTAFGQGNVYNNYVFGHLHNNKINLEVVPGDANGWTNENNFIGGRFSFESAEGTAVAGTRHIVLGKWAEHVVNNNVFLKPSVEGNVPEYHVENGGSYNVFQSARWEADAPKVLYTSDNANEANRNVIAYGYGAQNITFTFLNPGGGGAGNRWITARNEYGSMDGNGSGYQNGSSAANSIMRFYESGTKPELAAESDWSVYLGAQYFKGKKTADANERMKIDFQTGRIYYGDASAAAACFLGGYANAHLMVNCVLRSSTDAANDLGTTSARWKDAYFSGVGRFDGGIKFGAGSAGSANKAVCWKTTTTLGYCSTAPDASGACTCN